MELTDILFTSLLIFFVFLVIVLIISWVLWKVKPAEQVKVYQDFTPRIIKRPIMNRKQELKKREVTLDRVKKRRKVYERVHNLDVDKKHTIEEFLKYYDDGKSK